jgi:hypothetical protein
VLDYLPPYVRALLSPCAKRRRNEMDDMAQVGVAQRAELARIWCDLTARVCWSVVVATGVVIVAGFVR